MQTLFFCNFSTNIWVMNATYISTLVLFTAKRCIFPRDFNGVIAGNRYRGRMTFGEGEKFGIVCDYGYIEQIPVPKNYYRGWQCKNGEWTVRTFCVKAGQFYYRCFSI